MKIRIVFPLVVALALVLSACEALLQVPTEEAPEIVLPDDVVLDVARGGEFAFETYVAVDVSLSVTTIDQTAASSDGAYASRTVAEVLSATITDDNGSILFHGFFTPDGELSGVLGVATATQVAYLTISGPGVQNRTVEIENPSDLSAIVREMSVATNGVDVASRGIPTPDDQDGDGIPDVYDSKPDDPSMAIQTRYPANLIGEDGKVMERFFNVAFEDLYPRIGDGDYNDFVVSYYLEVMETDTDDTGTYATFISGRAFARARAAGYNHEFALRLPFTGVPGETTVTGETTVRTFLFENGDPESQSLLDRRDIANNLPFADDLRMVLFDQTYDAFGRENPARVSPDNGDPNGPTSVGYVTFFDIENTRIPIELLRPPFDPHIRIWGSRRPAPGDAGYDVHLIGQSPIPGSVNPPDIVDFKDAEGFPWALMVPGGFKHPSETTSIMDAYPGEVVPEVPPEGSELAPDKSFLRWVQTDGRESRDWYEHPNDDKALGLVVELP